LQHINWIYGALVLVAVPVLPTVPDGVPPDWVALVPDGVPAVIAELVPEGVPALAPFIDGVVLLIVELLMVTLSEVRLVFACDPDDDEVNTESE
jgi:hypothetical protein